MKEPNFLVRANCMTYNHAKYIENALDGFCMQQTNFPFICTIVDDASTDGEQDIIKAYLEKHFNLEDKKIARFEEYETHSFIYAQNKENKNCYFAVSLLKFNHYKKVSRRTYIAEWDWVKYHAPCEGDDFWTSPHKLQHQVDFMEKHPGYSLCFHAHTFLYSDGQKKDHFAYSKDIEDVPIEDMIIGGGGFMATNSMFYVQKFKENWPEWARISPVGDASTMITMAVRGKVGYINEVMSCYRVSTEGSWHQRIIKDKKKSKEHYQKTVLSWKKFDEWTDYKYHNIVKKKLLKNKIHFWAKRYSFIEKAARSVMKCTKRIIKR